MPWTLSLSLKSGEGGDFHPLKQRSPTFPGLRPGGKESNFQIGVHMRTRTNATMHTSVALVAPFAHAQMGCTHPPCASNPMCAQTGPWVLVQVGGVCAHTCVHWPAISVAHCPRGHGPTHRLETRVIGYLRVLCGK